MPSPRRSAIFAVLALLAGLAFAGCGRAQPGTAAYVGDLRITEKQIDEMVDEVRRAAPGRSTTGLRILVVRTLVMSKLSARTAEALSFPVQQPDYAVVARSTGLSENSELVRAIAELEVAGVALIQQATPVQPTDSDIRDIYEGLIGSQSIPDTATFAEVEPEIRSNAGLPGVLGARDLMLDHARKIGLDVNPRYTPLIAPIGNLQLPVVLSEGIGVYDGR